MGSLEGVIDTKLHEAVRYGDLDDVRIALRQGYDSNLIGLYQWSSLHEAANNGEVEILKLLLSHKGDPNKQDLLGGNTAVHYAAKEEQVECLRLLIEAGGKYNIRNSQGQTCLQVAKGECFQMLESLRVKDLMIMSTEEVKREILGEDSGVESPTDLDRSISTDYEGSVADDSKPPAMGYLHLTFEYHSHKGTLKIRVWQISDLLLPPPSTSMINTIYAKSYLLPDKKKESKRKTEEVKVEKVAPHVQFTKSDLSKGVQHVFSPSCFQFSKKLEYEGLSKDIIKEKSVQIEVCITQKYSKRSYLIGMFHLPLSKAVKKIVREKYSIIPCMNHTIPANMKVYSASQLQITNSSKIFYSNPDVRNLSTSDFSDRAASDPDLQTVTVLDVVSPRTVSVEVDDEELCPQMRDHQLDEVVIKAVSKQGVELAIPGEYIEGEISSDDESTKYPPHIVHITDKDNEDSENYHKSAFHSIKDAIKGKTKVETMSKIKEDSSSCKVTLSEGAQDWKYQDVKNSSTSRKSEVSESSSRPETPSWDYYDFEDIKVVDIPIDDSLPKKDGATPVCLPMETTLGLRSQGSKSKKKEKQTGRRKNSGDIEKKWPGIAVPQIVITDTDKEKKGTRSRTSPKKSLISKKKSKEETEEIIVLSPEKVKKKETKSSHRTITIDMNDDIMTKQGDGQFKVIADIHTDTEQDRDVSIDIGDSDSYIIDLENLEAELAEGDQSDAESINANKLSLTRSDSSASSKFRSKLALARPIPMQVYIDESLSDCDDTSDKNRFFTIGEGHKNEEVTEL